MSDQTIKFLEKNVYERIAAGEVIERPASVLRELLDNAIDAQSTKIRISFNQGGMQMVEVADNGLGMSKEDLSICYLKHTTSKILNFDDIYRIVSLGFRGEALYSIALVSQFEIISKREEDEIGNRIFLEGAELIDTASFVRNTGTTVKMTNLFYNLPARQKFIKSYQSETRKIKETFYSKSLPFLNISFDLYQDGKQILTVPSADNYLERISLFYNDEYNKNLIPLNTTDEITRNINITIEGYISPPSYFLNNKRDQVFYINNRPIFSPFLSHAVSMAYNDIIPKGKYPVSFLFITIDPKEIDVNIHPAKREIKFRNEEVIHKAIYSAIYSTLQEGFVYKSIEYKSKEAPHHQENIKEAIKESIDRKQPSFYPEIQKYSGFNNKTIISSESKIVNEEKPIFPPMNPITKTETQTELYPSEDKSKLIGIVFSTYIILEENDEILFIDQHAAHERLNYEKLKLLLNQKSTISQSLLSSYQISLSKYELEIIQDNIETLSNLGFNIKEIDQNSIYVDAIPDIINKKNIKDIILSLVNMLEKNPKFCDKLSMIDDWIKSQSCRNSVMSGNRLNQQEVHFLLQELLQYENPFVCPHGRPTVIKIKRQEIEKWFQRT